MVVFGCDRRVDPLEWYHAWVSKDEYLAWLRERQGSETFAQLSHDDYVLARVGIGMALPAAFALGCQSVEKMLKSFLLAHDLSDEDRWVREKQLMKDIRKKANVMGVNGSPGHSLEVCLQMCIEKGMVVASDVIRLANEWSSMFHLRYVERGSPVCVRSNQVHELDRIVLGIWDQFSSIRKEFFLREGPYRGALIALGRNRATHATQVYEVFSRDNLAWSARKLTVEGELRGLLLRWGYECVGEL